MNLGPWYFELGLLVLCYALILFVAVCLLMTVGSIVSMSADYSQFRRTWPFFFVYALAPAIVTWLVWRTQIPAAALVAIVAGLVTLVVEGIVSGPIMNHAKSILSKLRAQMTPIDIEPPNELDPDGLFDDDEWADEGWPILHWLIHLVASRNGQPSESGSDATLARYLFGASTQLPRVNEPSVQRRIAILMLALSLLDIENSDPDAELVKGRAAELNGYIGPEVRAESANWTTEFGDE